MNRYAVIDERGAITQTGYVADPEDIPLQGGTFESVASFDGVTEDTHWYDRSEGAFKRYPEKPDGDFIFDFESMSWVEHVDVEFLAARARAKRDFLLAESDWTQAADSPVDKLAWQTYRQLLRDVTLQSDFPVAITWPEPPGP